MWHGISVVLIGCVSTRAVASSHYAPPLQPTKCLSTFPSSSRCLRILNDYDHSVSPLAHLWAQDFVCLFVVFWLVSLIHPLIGDHNC